MGSWGTCSTFDTKTFLGNGFIPWTMSHCVFLSTMGGHGYEKDCEKSNSKKVPTDSANILRWVTGFQE